MRTLRQGDSGPAVTTLQRRILAAGIDIDPDGTFGPATEQAVMQIQRRFGLVIDGIAGAKTQAALLGRDLSLLLSHQDLQAAAEELAVELATLRALNEVESRGSGFLADGRPVILYERHIMARRLREHGQNADTLRARYPQLVNDTPGGYQGGGAEHYRLQLASTLHRPSALESCSWGLFQIMGYHWERLGYDSIEDFSNRMRSSERDQLQAFVRFIAADPKLHQALQKRHWKTVARRYNGPAYRAHQYDERLTAAYRRYVETEAIA